MENAYGIGVKNRYDLFYNDELDPFEILKKTEEEKERRKGEKGTKDKTKNVKQQKDRTSVVSNSQQQKKSKDIQPSSGQKAPETAEPPPKARGKLIGDKQKSSQDDFGEERNFKNATEHSPVTDLRDRNEGGEFRRGRGGFRSRGRGGRGRGGFYGSEAKKRDFDRHSGSDKTGVRSMDKRDGAGSNNWGSVKQDLAVFSGHADSSPTWDDANDDIEQTRKDTAEDNWEDSPGYQPEQDVSAPTGNENENVESKENVPVELEETAGEAVKEMTLDEWKREQESKRTVPKYNLRKPGEGEDNSQWKKLYVLKKKVKEGEEDEEDEEDDEGEDEEFGRRGRQRQLVDIQINFNYSRRGGRGRGRGTRGTGPRTGGIVREDQRSRDVGPPGGGGGGNRMSRGHSKMSKGPTQSAPRVDDWNDFPSLITA